MGIIEKKLLLKGSKGEIEIDAIFDSGATYSFIKKEHAEKLEILATLPELMEFGTAKEGEKLVAKQHIGIFFYMNGDQFLDNFIVIEDLSDDVIIGTSTMQRWRMKLDFEKEDVIYDPKVTKLRRI